MTKRDLIATAFVLAGIYILVIYGAGVMMQLVFYAQGMDNLSGLLGFAGSAVIGVVLAALGYAFIYHAPALARKLVVEASADEPAFPYQAGDIMAIAIAVLGVSMAAKGILTLGSTVVSMAFRHGTPLVDQLGGPAALLTRQSIPEAIRLALGLVLFFKASAITAFWRRMQESKGSGQDLENGVN